MTPANHPRVGAALTKSELHHVKRLPFKDQANEPVDASGPHTHITSPLRRRACLFHMKFRSTQLRTFRTIHALWTAAGVALLAGCATIYEDQFHFSEGWRVAEVVRVAPASLVDNPAYWNRMREPPEVVRQDRAYVLLSYRAFARKRHTLHPLPPNMGLRPGDPVYVRPGSCDDASIVKRGRASHRPTSRSAVEQSHPFEARDLRLPAQLAAQASTPAAAHRSGGPDSGAVAELIRWIS